MAKDHPHSRFDWDSFDLDAIVYVDVHRCTPDKVSDGAGSCTEVPSQTLVDCTVGIEYYGGQIAGMIYNATEDVRIGDFVLVPVPQQT